MRDSIGWVTFLCSFLRHHCLHFFGENEESDETVYLISSFLPLLLLPPLGSKSHPSIKQRRKEMNSLNKQLSVSCPDSPGLLFHYSHSLSHPPSSSSPLNNYHLILFVHDIKTLPPFSACLSLSLYLMIFSSHQLDSPHPTFFFSPLILIGNPVNSLPFNRSHSHSSTSLGPPLFLSFHVIQWKKHLDIFTAQTRFSIPRNIRYKVRFYFHFNLPFFFLSLTFSSFPSIWSDLKKESTPFPFHWKGVYPLHCMTWNFFVPFSSTLNTFTIPQPQLIRYSLEERWKEYKL